jgi:hypothetical protein
VDAGAVALLALPWLVLLADPLWVYSSLYRDPWAYFGFFQNLPGQLAAFKDHYAAGRLSVLLPGWAAYSVLPPATANLVLHVGVYSVAVLSGYAALAATVGRRAAFLAAAALGGHYFFLRAVGWDYADGYVVAYFLLATALVTRATRPGRWWKVWSAAAGAVAAAVAVAYLGAVVLLIPLAGLFVVLNRAGGRHPLDAAGFWVGAGFFGALAGFGLISRLLGGSVVFFLPSLVYAARTFGPEAASQYIFSPTQWVGRAGWLIFPVAAVAGAVVNLARLAVQWHRGEGTRADGNAAFFQLQFLGLLGLLGVKQMRGEFASLQVWLAASWAVMTPAFLAFGGQLRRWADGLTPGQFRAVAAVWVVLAAGGCLTAERLHIPGWGSAIPLAVALAGAVTAVLLFQTCPPRFGVGVAAAALFGLVCMSARAHFKMSDSLCGAAVPIQLDRCEAFDPQRRQCFRTIAEAARWANGLAPAGKVWFWYNLNDPLGPVYDMAAHTNGHYLQIVNVRFPDLPDGKVYRGDQVQTIARSGGGAVVVLSDDPAAGEKTLYWIRGCGMRAEQEDVRVLGRPPVAVRATVIRVAAQTH